MKTINIWRGLGSAAETHLHTGSRHEPDVKTLLLSFTASSSHELMVKGGRSITNGSRHKPAVMSPLPPVPTTTDGDDLFCNSIVTSSEN